MPYFIDELPIEEKGEEIRSLQWRCTKVCLLHEETALEKHLFYRILSED